MSAAVLTKKTNNRFIPLAWHAFVFAILIAGPYRRRLAGWLAYMAVLAVYVHAGHLTMANPGVVVLALAPAVIGYVIIIEAWFTRH